jgi:hypothetical protein
MRDKRIQGKVTTGRWTLPVVILICVVSWIVSLSLSLGNAPTTGPLPFGISDEWLSILPEWLYRLAGFAVFAAIGYFLIELNNVYAIIRTRATVQTSFYFLLVAACPALHTAYTGILVTIPLILSVFMLFRSYHAYSDAPRYVFASFALLAIASMLSPKVLYLLPVWLIGMAHFRALTLRSLCAMFIGAALPYWFLLAHAVFYKQMYLFTEPFTELVTFSHFGPATLPVHGITMLAYMLPLYVGCLVQFVTESYKDKLQTHSYLGFLLSLIAYSTLLIMLQPTMLPDLLTTMLISLAMLTAHLFVLTNTKGTNILFIVAMAGLAAVYIINLIHL